jgi:hypothetical protein
MITTPACEAARNAFRNPPPASSAVAFEIQSYIQKANTRFIDPPRAHPIDLVLADLDALAKECRESEWAGNNGAPVPDETIAFTREILKSIPKYFPPPSLGALPSGDLTLGWASSRRGMISLLVGREKRLGYVALIGSEKIKATVAWHGDFPIGIQEVVCKLFSFQGQGSSKHVHSYALYL